MKQIIQFPHLLIALLIMTCSVQGSDKERNKEKRSEKRYARRMSRADNFFKNFSYIKAIENYKSALKESENDPQAALQIAESYRMLNDPRNAVEWYEAVIDDTLVIKSQHKLRFAQVLTSNGRYEEARNWYAIAQQEIPGSKIPVNMLLGIENISQFYRDSLNYSVHILNINSDASDFSPAYYKEGIVFCSNRKKKDFFQPTYQWDNSNYLDLYYSKNDFIGSNEAPIRLPNEINTKYHEGPSVFFDDNRKVIFTRNNFNFGKLRTSAEGVSKLKLYYSAIDDKNGKWSTPVALYFDDDEYSTGHPTIAADGQLYFASDMPGSIGGSDIWKSEFIYGIWTTPENLGSKINTEGDEMFPFIKADGELYFASNGHKGMGGLDIFRARIDDEKFEVLNLGFPVNTKSDDFGLIMKGNQGFFSSNRQHGKGSDDIYKMWYNLVDIDVLLIDATSGDVLTGELKVVDDRYNDQIQLIEVEDGIRFIGIRGRSYMLNGLAEGYEPGDLLFSTHEITSDQDSHIIRIPLTKSKS